VTTPIDDLCRRFGFVTANSLAGALGVSRQAAHRQLSAAVAAGELRAEGQARARRYVPAVPWFEFEIAGLDEDRALDQVRKELDAAFRGLSDLEERLLVYAFSEMVNNAIDHSKGQRVRMRLSIRAESIELEVVDDGIGAFASVQGGRGLATVVEAAAELTKGKVTTMPSRHTGEGVFFTSKAMDRFELTANGLSLVVDNDIDDTAIRVAPEAPGTRMHLRFRRPPQRSLQSVFEAWTDQFEFSRTRTVVKLFGLGRDFVSRSEARRLLQGLESFREVVVDFQGVAGIGQAFADEVFRVFALQHPGIRLVPVNMVPPVQFFVERAERARRGPA
jgi:anti-sigma regulatory factor (Ser/Thr protein kinase)